MPQRRRKPAPRPKQPARVRKAKTEKRRRRRGENTQRHPELWGLALVAAGVFLAAVLWLGWDGGAVGRGIERGCTGGRSGGSGLGVEGLRNGGSVNWAFVPPMLSTSQEVGELDATPIGSPTEGTTPAAGCDVFDHATGHLMRDR